MGDYAWAGGPSGAGSMGGMGLMEIYPGGIPRDSAGGLISVNTPPGVPTHTAGQPLTAQQIQAAGLEATIPPSAWFDAPKTNWWFILGVGAVVWILVKGKK